MNAYGNFPCQFILAREGCIEILLRLGANPNEKDFHNFTALHFTAMCKHTYIYIYI